MCPPRQGPQVGVDTRAARFDEYFCKPLFHGLHVYLLCSRYHDATHTFSDMSVFEDISRYLQIFQSSRLCMSRSRLGQA